MTVERLSTAYVLPPKFFARGMSTATASTRSMRMNGSPGPGAAGGHSPAFPGGPMMRLARGGIKPFDGWRRRSAGRSDPPGPGRAYYTVETVLRGHFACGNRTRGLSAWRNRMPTFDLDTYVARSGALDLDAIAWDEVPRYPLSPEAARTLRFMQDIESHTIIYLRS